jgi:CRISPR-associated protein Cas6
MYWTQDENPAEVTVPDDIVDVLFSIECRQLPVDHAYALSDALTRVCPWMAHEPGLAVHAVHVAGSQNGWERPAHGTANHIQLSRRTKLTIRTPKSRVDSLLDALTGSRISVADCPLTIGEGKVRPLSKETTLFARYLVTSPAEDETAFLQAAAEALARMDIRVRKALCGKHTPLSTGDGEILTRSLMLADLSTDESIRLQQQGLGPRRLMGCGIFIPHKGIDAVSKTR